MTFHRKLHNIFTKKKSGSPVFTSFVLAANGAILYAANQLSTTTRHGIKSTRLEENSSSSSLEGKAKQHVFDLTKEWRSHSTQDEFWKKIRTIDSSTTEQETNTTMSQQKTGSSWADMQSLASNFSSLMSGGQSESSVTDIVAKARERTSGGDIEDKQSVDEILAILKTYKDDLVGVAKKYGDDIDFDKVDLPSLMYYLEYEDERKNASWQRRMHRFYPGINFAEVTKLNDYLEIAILSYVDTLDEIKEGLEKHPNIPCEVVYGNVKSAPGEPANFIAVPKNQPSGWGAPLEVIIGVRGTKSVSDAITDLLCDAEDFKGGKAHSFIMGSGKFLVDSHTPILEDLLKSSGKSKIKLTLVGHSLGAGAASIAGIEFNDHKNIDVQVYGFGCPALLSADLAKKSSYITTVVNDSDLVPRMSGATVRNLMLNISEFNVANYAKRDVKHYLEELGEGHPRIFSKSFVEKSYDSMQQLIDKYGPKPSEKVPERGDPVLFPPGKCIHLYRDGYGFSGCVVPNTYFKEIDVTRRMVDDHVNPSGYQYTLLEIMRDYTHNLNFKFGDEKEAK